MDLDEILSFKPEKPSLKRLTEDDLADSDLRPPQLKQPRGAVGGGQNSVAGAGMSDEEKLRILQSLEEEEDEEEGEGLDASAVKRMLLSFEKKVLRNQEMRVKFPDLPERFMESELELNEELQTLHVIATTPEFYPILSELNAVQTLLGLLSHDNSDIALAVVDLVQELTDVETGSEEEVEGLIAALLKEQIVALLVQVVERLDEKAREDADGVHNVLAIVENMSEFKNSEVCLAAGEQGLLNWLLRRLRVRQYDVNKLYVVEILAILLQSNETNQRQLGERDGIDNLLQALAYYKRRDPQTPDEIEMMENLFDCLCSALMFAPNRERFLKGEGLQLMILMLKERKMSRRPALKVLNHAMCNSEGAENCVKFVEVYGLRSLFPVFMKPPKSSKKAASGLELELEEHMASIIASLFRNVQGAFRDRLVSKFLENDCEKVERLMELHFRYKRRVTLADEEIKRERRLGSETEIDETEAYLRRLDAGLFTLQLVDYVMAELYLCSIPAVRTRIQTLLSQQRDTLASVRMLLSEYVESMGDEDSSDVVKQEQQRLNELISKLI